jgi:kynureninase
MTVDFAREREQFPTLVERTYLASQNLGPFPREMLADLRAYEQSLIARNRGLGDWFERWTEMHGLTESLLEAPRGSVFLRDSATAAQAAIAASVEPEGARRRILVSSVDFHSSRYLWHAQTQRGFEIVEVGDGKSVDPEELYAAIDERVRIVALSLVSPRTGAMIDAARVAEKAHRAGALFMLDAFQAIGVVPVRVASLGADVVVGGFHKWVGGGGTGLAFGYVAPALCAALTPRYPGWTAHRNVLGFEDRFAGADSAQKFQQGMPPMEPIYTSRAGIRWVLKTGIDTIRQKNLGLTERIIRRAQAAKLVVRTPSAAAERGGMVCIDIDRAAEIARALTERGIDIDARPGAGLRIGPHACLTEEECDRTVDGVVELSEKGA